jgi:Fanconi anemia group M protein
LNEKDTAKYIHLLAKKSTDPEFSLRASKFTLSDEERLQFILEGFPQIGPINAKKLLTKFGTFQDILLASDPELKEVIGKKADELIRLKNVKYRP